MNQMKMAGHTLNRDRYLARSYAEELSAEARDKTSRALGIRFGPNTVRIHYGLDDWLSRFICQAFIASEPLIASEPSASVRILRSSESKTHHRLDWAQMWIRNHEVLPFEITKPFRIFLDIKQGLSYLFNTETGEGVIKIRRESELDPRSFVTPFRLMFSWIANGFGAEIIHGAAITRGGKSLLLSGGSGSGKSTLALLAMSAGFNLLSDDCILVHESDMFAVYSRVKVERNQGDLLGLPPVSFRNVPHHGDAKPYVQVQSLNSTFSPTSPLTMIGFPVIRTSPGYYRVPAIIAQRRLTTDSLREIFGGTTENAIRLEHLATSFPAYRIILGNNSIDGGVGNIAVLERIFSDEI